MPENKNQTMRLGIVALILIGAVTALNFSFDALSWREDFGQMVYGILMLLFASSALAFGDMGEKMKHLLIWAMIFVVGMIGYSYRHELSSVKEKVLAELIPGRGVQNGLSSARFPVSDNGHFYIRARVNGKAILFLADTGATSIVLTPKDAIKLGYNPSTLTFDRFFQTANGMVRGSSIRLDSFQVGDFRLRDIGASVNEADMGESLLGMAFFEKLERYEVKGDVLTLYW